MRRWLAAWLLRGPHAEFIREDLLEMYARDRARGLSWLRSETRYLRRLASSTLSVWRAELPDPDTDPRGSRWRALPAAVVADARFGLRLYRRRPVPVAIAIGGLALAIGVAAAVFTIVDNSMLKPFGMDEPSSVITVAGDHGWSEWKYSTFARWRDEAEGVRLEASSLREVRYAIAAGAEDEPRRRTMFVSGGYLDLFGGRPAIGRPLGPQDDEPGAPLVAVVSDRFWMNELDGDSTVVGRPLWINGSPVTIVGVLRPEFTGPSAIRPSIWMPLAAQDDVTGVPATGPESDVTVSVVGRLAPGVDFTEAQTQLVGIVGRATARPVAVGAPVRPPVVRVFSAASPMSGRDAADSYLAVASFFGLVALVLAVACANTANLLFAVATTRQHEMGVRLSLGASTRRLVRQMLHESLMLAAIAGGLGAVCSMWLGPWLASVLVLSPEVGATPDARTLAFTIGVSLLCGFAAGLSPARYGARGQVLAALQSQAGGHAATGRSRRRSWFIGFQAAVSMFLLVAAALFARTALVTSRTELGFDADRMLAVSMGGSRTGINEAAYVQAAADALRAIPSVEQLSVVERVPWGWSTHRMRFDHDGRSYAVNVMNSDELFFEAAGVQLLRGRTFTRQEVQQGASVAIISETVARAFFTGADPVGQPLSRIPSAMDETGQATVIGVVADAMLSSMDAEVFGAIYRPIRALGTDPSASISLPGFVIRTTNPARMARDVERALRLVNARVQPATVVVRERIETFIGWKRMFAWLSVPAAAFVVLLSMLGLFGVTMFVIGQRMPELSIRMALGASSGSVGRLLVRDSLRPVAIGLMAGLGGALPASSLTARMFNLSGISPHDPLALGAAVTVLLTGALLAVIVPARRVSRVSPAVLLRRV